MENTIDYLSLNLHLIPKDVSIDVMKRIIDWTSSGGSYDDDYVKRQVKYALSFVKEGAYEQ